MRRSTQPRKSSLPQLIQKKAREECGTLLSSRRHSHGVSAARKTTVRKDAIPSSGCFVVAAGVVAAAAAALAASVSLESGFATKLNCATPLYML